MPSFSGREDEVPLAVSATQRYEARGYGLVPHKAAVDIGYQGIKFTKQKDYAELGSYDYQIV